MNNNHATTQPLPDGMKLVHVCPTCGCPVKVGGDGKGPGSTHYYIPIRNGEILPDELEAKVKALVDVAKEVSQYPNANKTTKLSGENGMYCLIHLSDINRLIISIEAVEKLMEGK
jgi:hypothetical protein